MSDGQRWQPAAGLGRAPDVLIDLHNHTSPRSACSSLDPDDLVKAAIEAGLDAVCVTEHDRTWTAEAVEELRQKHGFLVLRGIEASTNYGHVLVFGVDRLGADTWNIARLRSKVDAAGGAAVLSHPSRGQAPSLPPERLPQLFDALEGLNGSETRRQNEAALRLGRELGLPTTGGSDAHCVGEVGVCATRFGRPIADEQQLAAALRAGDCEPVLLRPSGALRA